MSFLGDTMLVPEHGALPKNFAFFKIIHGQIKDGTRIKVVKGRDTFIATVFDNRVHKDVLAFEINDGIHTNYLVNTHDYIIIEVDPIPGKVINPNLENVGDHQEDVLIKRITTHPALAEKIPQVLWDRTNFQRKIVSANLPLEGRYVPDTVKTMARMRRNDSLASKTGTLDTDLLPDYPVNLVNEFLGLKTPTWLDKAKLEKTARHGGRRTRRFKK